MGQTLIKLEVKGINVESVFEFVHLRYSPKISSKTLYSKAYKNRQTKSQIFFIILMFFGTKAAAALYEPPK